MKRNLKRFIAFSLSLAIVGTSVNVPVSTVKANTLDKGTPFTGCNIVSSADDDVKFTKGADSQNKAKASKPDYWGILDGDTSLTKLGTYNEEEDEYTGEAGSGIVTWQNNENVKSSDMGNFKFRFDYLIKDGKGGRDLNAYDSNYSGNGDTYSDGDVCGFEFKPLYATSRISVWGVSPYQNYTTGDVVIKANEADLEKMTLEYYRENALEPTIVDLSTVATDGTYTLEASKKGWYYLTYEDDGYMSDSMGDEVTGGAQKNTKGQIFGFSFYTGNDSDTNIEKVKDHVNVSKSSTGKLQSVSIDSSDSNLTKITPLTYVVDNSGKVASNSNSSTNLSSAKAVITTVREYYKVKEGNFYQTLTRVKTYYSESGSSNFKYSSGSYKYYRPEINVSTYSNYLPYIMKNYFANNFTKSNYVVFDKGSYNGNYKMKYQIPDASVSGGKRTIDEDIVVDYGAPFIKVYDKDNSWKTMKSGGSYSVKNGATVKALDTFSNIKDINLSNIKYKFTKEGKTALEIDGTDLGATQNSSTGDISFKAVRNTGSYATKEDNVAVATKSGYTSEADASSNASTYEFDINDNNKLTLQKVNKYDTIKCSVDGKTPYTMDADLTVDQESSDTLDITNLFTKVGTYEFKVKYTANTLGASSDGVYPITSSTSYYSNFTVNVVDKKIYDADSVSVTIPTLKDDSLAANSLSSFTCTFNFEDGTASVPSSNPTGDNDGQLTAPTPKPDSEDTPQTTSTPSTTQAPTSKPTQTPEQCNLQDYWQDGNNAEVYEPIKLTWNKKLLNDYKSDAAEEEVAFYVWEQGNNDKTFKDLTEETSIEVNKIGAWKFEYFDGEESHYFYITYISDDVDVTPAPTKTPEPTPTTTEDPEKITGDDLECVPLDEDGNPLKQQYVNGVTIKNIPESVKVTVDGNEYTDRPIRITERGKHTLEIAGKTYILEIVSAYDIFSESQRVIQVPKSITITDNNDKEISIDGEKITSFPYTLDTVGKYSIEVIKSGVEVNVVDYEGNPVLDENGNAIRDTVKSINSIEVSVLPDVEGKNIVGKEYTIDNLIKYSKEPNETLRGKGSVTITGISSSKIVYVDSKVVKGSSVTIVGDGSHYLTIYDVDSKELKTVIVYVSTTDVSLDEIKNNDTIIADDSVTITDIPDGVTVIVDGKEVTERPVVISSSGKHDIIIKDGDEEKSTTVVITGSGSTVVDKEDIKDIVENTPEGETPTIKGDNEVILDVPENSTVIVDGNEVKDRPVIIDDNGRHDVVIKDPETGEETRVDVIIDSNDKVIVDGDEIKDIIENTPEGETPVISGGKEVIIDVPEDVPVIVDGNEVKDRPIKIDTDGKHEIIIKDPNTGEETKVDVVIGDKDKDDKETVVNKDDIKDIVNNTPEGEKPTIKDDNKVIIDVPDDIIVIVDGEEIKERPVIIDDNGEHELIIKDPNTGEETKVDVIINNKDKVVIDGVDIKDIIDKTPEGETPVINAGKEVIIDVPDNVTVIIDGKEVTDRPVKIDASGKHEVIIKDPNTGEETRIDVIIDSKDKIVVDEEDIKDIIANTPEGETPTISGGQEVIIEVPEGADVTVDGEEVTDKPIKVTDKGEHDVVIKDPVTGDETHIKVEIGNNDDKENNKESDKDPVYDLGDILDGNVTNTDKPSKDDNGNNTEGEETGTGSKTDVETPITPVVSYISGIVNNGIYMNGVKIVNNGFTIYVTKDGGERKTYTSSLIELNEAGKYKIEAEKDNEIKYTFNIEIVVKEVDTSKTETADKDTIKDGGVYEGGVTIPNDGDDPIYVDGKPIIGTPVVITDPGEHEIIIDGEVITIIIPENTKPDGGVDSSKPIKPIELPSSDKLLNGETYPGGVIIPKPENGDKVIVDGKEITEFPYTVTGDGEHIIQIGGNEPIKIIVKDTEIPDIPIIDTGVKPSPSPTAPTGSNNNKDNNNSNNNNIVKETPKPSNNSSSGSYSGVKNKKSYKKAVKITLNNVKSGFASYKKSKKSKAKVSKFGSGTVVYRASKQGTYTIKVTCKDGKSETIKFTIDKKKPTVNVKAGKKYKKGKKVTVKDGLSGIKKVTLNGKKCKTKFKLKNKGKNTICVWDKAGNKRTIKVKVK